MFSTEYKYVYQYFGQHKPEIPSQYPDKQLLMTKRLCGSLELPNEAEKLACQNAFRKQD